MEMVLNDGEGLTLGPDSDALLNFCDMPMPAQTAAQPGPSTPAAEDKGKALAGTDDEVRAVPSLTLLAAVLQSPHNTCFRNMLVRRLSLCGSGDLLLLVPEWLHED